MTTATDPHAFKPDERMGEPTGHDNAGPVALDDWRQLLDKETGKPTGYVKRFQMRTLMEVFQDLRKRLDVVVCESCKAERPRPARYSDRRCKKCGEEEHDFIDEYFAGPDTYHDSPRLVPHTFRWIACYPVTGGSEGHYVHVDFVCQDDPYQPHFRHVRLALGKTFRGMDHAAEMARRCAVLLGA